MTRPALALRQQILEAFRAGKAVPGNRIVYLGDSVTLGSWENATMYQNEAYPLYATLLSGGRILTGYNAGISGNNTAQMLARFDADVAAQSPAFVLVNAGTNDTGQNVDFATWRADIQTLLTKIRNLGVRPVMSTIIPRSDATIRARVQLWNAWIRAYAATNGIPLVDFHAVLVDPTTGSFASGYDSGDGVHPSNLARKVMGQAVVDALLPLLPPSRPPLVRDNTDVSLLGNNAVLVTDSNADGVPDGWFAYSGATGFAHALVTDSLVPGKLMQMTMTAAASLRAIQRNLSSGSWAVGDRLAFCGLVTTDGGVKATAKMTLNGPGTNAQAAVFTNAVTRGVFYQEVVVPAGTTSITVDLIASAGTGVVAWGQPTVRNLTAMGL